MRALHLNPWTKTVTEVDLEHDEDGITYDALRRKVFHSRSSNFGLIERADMGSNVDAYFDEEGMLVNWEEQRFVELIPPGEQSGQTFAGHVVLTGNSGWGSPVALHPAITVEVAQRLVRWPDAREVTAPGIKLYTEAEDGSMELAYDAGTHDFNNQP